MKKIRNMSQVELAAYIQDTLQNEGITVVLSGGGAVSYYSSDKYVSKDLDLINVNFGKPVKEISEFQLATGTLRIVSATDCVKDRLCAFYFWNDQQGLAQAVLVAESQNVDLKEIKRWSKVEGKAQEYEIFKKKLG